MSLALKLKFYPFSVKPSKCPPMAQQLIQSQNTTKGGQKRNVHLPFLLVSLWCPEKKTHPFGFPFTFFSSGAPSKNLKPIWRQNQVLYCILELEDFVRSSQAFLFFFFFSPDATRGPAVLQRSQHPKPDWWTKMLSLMQGLCKPSEPGSRFHQAQPSFVHGCCWETFYIFAYCGLVGTPHSTAKIRVFLLPLQH